LIIRKFQRRAQAGTEAPAPKRMALPQPMIIGPPDS
jgi:hypothetical protein